MKVIIDSKNLNQAGENLKIDLQDIIYNRNDEYVVAAVLVTIIFQKP